MIKIANTKIHFDNIHTLKLHLFLTTHTVLFFLIIYVFNIK